DLRAMIARLDVEDHAWLAVAVGGWIIDLADGVIGVTRSDIALGATRLQIRQGAETDRHTQVDLDLAHRVTQVLEGKAGVAAGIADNNQTAAAAHHLVDAEVLEMAAVGQVDVLLVLARHAQELGQERAGRRAGTVVPVRHVAGWPRIAKPPAESDIEERH